MSRDHIAAGATNAAESSAVTYGATSDDDAVAYVKMLFGAAIGEALGDPIDGKLRVCRVGGTGAAAPARAGGP